MNRRFERDVINGCANKKIKILLETFGVAMRDSTLLLCLLFGLFMFTAAFTAVPA